MHHKNEQVVNKMYTDIAMYSLVNKKMVMDELVTQCGMMILFSIYHLESLLVYYFLSFDLTK